MKQVSLGLRLKNIYILVAVSPFHLSPEVINYRCQLLAVCGIFMESETYSLVLS